MLQLSAKRSSSLVIAGQNANGMQASFSSEVSPTTACSEVEFSDTQRLLQSPVPLTIIVDLPRSTKSSSKHSSTMVESSVSPDSPTVTTTPACNLSSVLSQPDPLMTSSPARSAHQPEEESIASTSITKTLGLKIMVDNNIIDKGVQDIKESMLRPKPYTMFRYMV